MTDIMANAKKHFRDQISGSLKGPIEVPEWGTDGQPVEVYYKAKINFNQMNEIVNLQANGKILESIVTSLIIRCLDEDGKPLFRKANKTEMMRGFDPDVMIRVSTDMGDTYGDLGALDDEDMGN